MGRTLLGLVLGSAGGQAAVIIADHDNPGGVPTQIVAEAADLPAASSANYAFVALPSLGAPLQVTEDGTAILVTYNGGNVYAYRWKQGVVTELSCIRPAGTRIKLHAANRNGMVVVVFELPTRAYFTFEGGATKQVVVAWMPDSTTPVFLNVPIAEATTWGAVSTMRSVDFKFLDDQNRIWGETYHVVQGPDGTLVYPELARWDTPGAAATFIGHQKNLSPSVNLLGVSSGAGEPFGYYSPPEAGAGSYYFAGSFSNRLNYVPARMNRQGWVLGKRGLTPVLSRDGVEYPLPAANNIALIDDQNNLYDINRFTVWTTDAQTFESTPTLAQNSYVARSTNSIALSEGYSTNLRVVPGDKALQLGNLFDAGSAVPAIFAPAEIRPDADRDGIITLSRRADDPDRLLAEKKLPWYFWVNDDDDSGETDGTDIPGDGSNGRDGSVNGVRDLIDFFPLHLNIARLLSLLPPTTPGISYRLAQADGAANFLTTDLAPAEAGKYHSDATLAIGLGGKPVTRITADGVPLDAAFIAQASIQDKGVILVEARAPTTKPLRLEVRRDAELLARLDLPLSFAGVETMFRHRNLVKAVNQKAITLDRNSTTNWPDALNNNQAFVFIHGYNVNQKQARGWQAEFFKRLWWTGSKTQFWGVTWYGYESQRHIPREYVTGDYHSNVVYAFGTAMAFNQFLGEVRNQPGITRLNVAAHSLGNMVTSSAISDHGAPVDRYFLLNAAVAKEAYDSGEAQSPDATASMPHTDWNKAFDHVYPSRLWASNWHELFASAPEDARNKLTWRDRFPMCTGTAYYDFHSTGEQVLAEDLGATPSISKVLFSSLLDYIFVTLPGRSDLPTGTNSWAWQEKLKGRTVTGRVAGSNFGGWGFNNFILRNTPMSGGNGPRLAPVDMTPEDAIAAEPYLLSADLQAEPFFRPGRTWKEISSWSKQTDGSWKKTTDRLGSLYKPTTGSTMAARQRDTLLARMIPALSLPAGSRPVIKFVPTGSTAIHNFNMSSTEIRVNSEPWAVNRNGDNRWRHSDLQHMAYPYVHGLYAKLVEIARLREQSP
ncbi:MAG TPA: alpha/beta hydrolase [Lacunisphaera sp.]